jgi:hypothetical protein
VVQELNRLCPDRPEAIQPEDWKALKGLPSPSATNVEQLFYPGAPLGSLFDTMQDDEAKGGQYRSPKFLAALSHAEYHAAYMSIPRTAGVVDTASMFPDIEAILNRGRKEGPEGPIVSQVISQVVQWINPKPTVVGTRENNKPPYWRDFMPALNNMRNGCSPAPILFTAFYRHRPQISRIYWDRP